MKARLTHEQARKMNQKDERVANVQRTSGYRAATSENALPLGRPRPLPEHTEGGRLVDECEQADTHACRDRRIPVQIGE